MLEMPGYYSFFAAKGSDLMPRYLMKSCKPEHHLGVAKALRLGSLNWFRKNPDPDVGDEGEAALSTSLTIDQTTTIAADLLSSISPYSISFGNEGRLTRRPAVIQINAMSLLPAGSSHSFIVDGYDAQYQTKGSDALIFCMTMVDDKSSTSRMDYQCEWKMDFAKVSFFADNLVADLNWHLVKSPEIFERTYLIENVRNTQDLRFEVVHGPVRYRDRTIYLHNPDLDEMNDLAWLIENPDMIKAESYANQDEYRFCFRLMLGTKLIPMRSNFEFIDIEADAFRCLLLE